MEVQKFATRLKGGQGGLANFLGFEILNLRFFCFCFFVVFLVSISLIGLSSLVEWGELFGSSAQKFYSEP